MTKIWITRNSRCFITRSDRSYDSQQVLARDLNDMLVANHVMGRMVLIGLRSGKGAW